MRRQMFNSLPRRASVLTAVVVVLVSAGAVATAVALRWAGTVVDRLLDGREAVVLAVVTTVLAVAGSMLNTGSLLLTTRIATDVAIDLRRRLVSHTLALPARFFTERSVGEITSRISTDVDTIADGLVEQGQPAVWGAVGALVAWITAWTVSPWLALAFVPIGMALWAAAARLGPPAARAAAAVEQEWSEAAGTAEEAFDGRSDLRQSLGRGLVMRRWAEHGARLWVLCRRKFATRRRLSLTTVAILRGFQFLVVAVGAIGAVRGTVSAGTVWLAFGLVRMFSSRVEEVLQNLPKLTEFVAAFLRVGDLLDEDAEPSIAVEPAISPEWGHAVEVVFDDVTFAYEDDEPVLARVRLVAPAGSFTAVVGRTGSGKSTLARLVTRGVETPPGSVSVGGVDVCRIPLAELRRHVGVLTQRVEVLGASVHDNVTLFDPAIPRKRVIEAFAQLGLGDWVAALPDGVDTVIGERGVGLSMGEAQLVAFARLLVRDPSVVILDEATARLDPQTEELVRSATARVLAGRTAVVIAHRLSTIRHADQVAVLDAGRVVECGPPRELAERPGGRFRRLVDAAGGVDAVLGAPDSRSEPADVSLMVEATARSPLEFVGDEPETPGTHFPLVRTSVGLLRRHRHSLVPGLAGWYGWFLSGAIATWTWTHLLGELREGGDVTAPIVVLAVSVLVGLVGLALGHTYFSRWWMLTEVTTRSNLVATQLHPTDSSTGRHRVTAGDAVSRLWDLESLIVYTDRIVDVFGTSLFVVAVTAVTGRWSTVGWLLIPVAVPLLVAFCMRRAIAVTAIDHAEVKGTWTSRVAEVCASASTVKGFGAEAGVVAHVGELTERRQRLAQRQRAQAAILRGSVWWTAMAGQMLVLVATAMSARGNGTAGVAEVGVSIAIYEAISMMPIAGLVATALVHEGPAVRAKLARLARLVPPGSQFDLSAPPRDLVLPPDTPVPVPTRRPGRVPLELLEVRDLGVTFDDGTPALSGIDLSVARGEIVVVTGPVGSGKTTLLRVLSGLLPPTGGAVHWNGAELADPSAFLRPPNCAFVAQTPRLVSGTVAENVSLDHDVDVAAALELAQLYDEVDGWGGSSAVLGHRGLRLSGGQAQRMATARALATGSELLVLDDLSSALDPVTEQQVWSGLRAAGHTVIAASHQQAAFAAADRVVRLVGGRLVDEAVVVRA